MANSRLFSRVASLTGVAVISWCAVGCSTLNGLGLPLGGAHELSGTAEKLRKGATVPAPLPRELDKDVLRAYIVEPGDVLAIEAGGLDSPLRFAGSDQTVKPDGTIDLGKYGRLIVAGKTVAEVQTHVQSLADADKADDTDRKNEAPVLVRLLSWESKVFYVLGEVSAPGAFPYSGRETVLDGIVAAGGLTNRANRHKLILTRPSLPEDCRTVLPICYNHIVQLGDTTSNYQLLPGDRVFVASMTLLDDLAQTFLPLGKQRCPHCGNPHVSCFSVSGAARSRELLTESTLPPDVGRRMVLPASLQQPARAGAAGRLPGAAGIR